jgi:hypothetical protein
MRESKTKPVNLEGGGCGDSLRQKNIDINEHL